MACGGWAAKFYHPGGPRLYAVRIDRVWGAP